VLCTACALCHVLLAYMYFVTLNHVSRSHLLHATGLSKTSSSPPRLHPSSSLHFYYLLLYYLTLLPTIHRLLHTPHVHVLLSTYHRQHSPEAGWPPSGSLLINWRLSTQHARLATCITTTGGTQLGFGFFPVKREKNIHAYSDQAIISIYWFSAHHLMLVMMMLMVLMLAMTLMMMMLLMMLVRGWELRLPSCLSCHPRLICADPFFTL